MEITTSFFIIFLKGDHENNEKTRQNAENKHTFDFERKSGKIEIEGKTRQNAENKQPFDL